MSEQHPEPAPDPAPEPAQQPEPSEPQPERPEQSELQPVVQPAPRPAAPPPPAWYPPAPVPPARSREKRDLLVAGALVVVAALVGGGYLLFGKGGGDGRPAAEPTPAATATKAYGVTAGGTHYGDLGELLLPMQRELLPGPDFQQYGNDTVLGAAQAKAMAEDGGGRSELTAKERKQVDAELDAMHIKGAALRTYRNFTGSAVYQITIVQVGNKLAAGAGPEAFRKLSEGSDVFGKGPAVRGHPHAVCVLPGSTLKDSDDDFQWADLMYCQATEGDLMVTFQVVGAAPLETGEAAAVMAKQLDRIQAPGEGV